MSCGIPYRPSSGSTSGYSWLLGDPAGVAPPTPVLNGSVVTLKSTTPSTLTISKIQVANGTEIDFAVAFPPAYSLFLSNATITNPVPSGSTITVESATPSTLTVAQTGTTLSLSVADTSLQSTDVFALPVAVTSTIFDAATQTIPIIVSDDGTTNVTRPQNRFYFWFYRYGADDVRIRFEWCTGPANYDPDAVPPQYSIPFAGLNVVAWTGATPASIELLWNFPIIGPGSIPTWVRQAITRNQGSVNGAYPLADFEATATTCNLMTNQLSYFYGTGIGHIGGHMGFGTGSLTTDQIHVSLLFTRDVVGLPANNNFFNVNSQSYEPALDVSSANVLYAACDAPVVGTVPDWWISPGGSRINFTPPVGVGGGGP